jgi:hypothetical protein
MHRVEMRVCVLSTITGENDGPRAFTLEIYGYGRPHYLQPAPAVSQLRNSHRDDHGQTAITFKTLRHSTHEQPTLSTRNCPNLVPYTQRPAADAEQKAWAERISPGLLACQDRNLCS